MTRETRADSPPPKVHVGPAAVRSMRPRYAVVPEEASSAPGFWLERDGRQLLAGPQATLEAFADLLNLTNPPERTLPEVLRACMSMTRGCIFTPGEHLRRIGRSAAA